MYNFVSAYDISNLEKSLETKIKNGKNISDDELSVDLRTFINDYGFRREEDEKQVLRTPRPRFYPPPIIDLKLKILDLMRQSLYDAQDHIRNLDPILKKYKDDASLRMAFTFDRLEQIVMDSRRVFTIASKMRSWKRVHEQMIWYTHCLHKFFDVLYIVEHLIDTHFNYLELLG
nr:uncharacterized protein LOC113404330 [Vanessa tameamea]